MSDLPPAWVLATLGEVCEVVGGATPKTVAAEYWGGGIPWVTPDDLSRHSGIGISHGARSLTEAGFRSASLTRLPPGTVLFSSRAPIGYAAIAEAPLCTNQGFKSLIPSRGVSSRYLYWYLRHATPLIQSMASGTTFKEISKGRMQEVPLPLPPAAEQERIVAAIEENLSRLDAADAVIRSTRPRFGALRMTTISQVLMNRRWPIVRWSDVGQTLSGRAFPSASYGDEGVLLLRPGNLSKSGRVVWAPKATTFLPARFAERSKYVLAGRNLLMNLTAQSLADDFLGRVCLSDHSDYFLLNQRIAKLSSSAASDEYLFWVFRSAAFRRFVAGLNTGSLIQHISTKQLASFRFTLPPLEDQGPLVDEIKADVDVVDRAELATELVSRRFSQLRRSILAAAFSGRLVSQDAAEEPAAILLETVRVQRAAGTATRRTRKVKAS